MPRGGAWGPARPGAESHNGLPAEPYWAGWIAERRGDGPQDPFAEFADAARVLRRAAALQAQPDQETRPAPADQAD